VEQLDGEATRDQAIRTIGADHVALREQVLAELRRRIIDGDYRQGERLTETRLADDFGVSRNPVREALRVVEAPSGPDAGTCRTGTAPQGRRRGDGRPMRAT